MNWRILISMMSVALFLTTGCASLPCQGNSFKACIATCQRLNVAPTHYVLIVNIASQSASLYEQNRFVKTFSCSTSRFGIGEVLNSQRTPRGLHRIAEKIGDGEPPGTIFQDREVIGYVSELGAKAGSITTRIMWLEGLEPGYNRGGDVDTHERTIYIHGTGDQNSIGRPASHGCIHFADPDLISLFDLLPSGTLVWIAAK
ncbi:MAG: L,D-transpeptidase [Verrucomicrobia bacterium]|nr:L,D-transpeptidase [Verrucomicrobiota bacterium]